MYCETLESIGWPVLGLTTTYFALTALVLCSRHTIEYFLEMRTRYTEIIDFLGEIFDSHNLRSADYLKSRNYGYLTSLSTYQECINNMYRSLMFYYTTQIYVMQTENASRREIDFIRNNAELMMSALSEENITEKNTLCMKLYELSNTYHSYEEYDEIVAIFNCINKTIRNAEIPYEWHESYIPGPSDEDSDNTGKDSSDSSSDDETSAKNEGNEFPENTTPYDSLANSSDSDAVENLTTSNNVENKQEEHDKKEHQNNIIVAETTESETDNNISIRLFSPRKFISLTPTPVTTQSVLDTPQIE